MPNHSDKYKNLSREELEHLADDYESALKGVSSLRDQFAMAALTGMLAYSHVNPIHGNYNENCSQEVAAHTAYQYADELLKARGGE